MKWLKTIWRNYCSAKFFVKGNSKIKKNTHVKKKKENLHSIIKQIGKLTLGRTINMDYGVCPHCEMYVSMLSFRKGFYTCINCREVVKQHINGSIKYVPVSHGQNKI